MLCVHLKRWPIDRLRRRWHREHEWQGSPPRASSNSVWIETCGKDCQFGHSRQGGGRGGRVLLPQKASLVLVETSASRQLITAACERAEQHGIRPGMTLAEARALCADLAHADADPARDVRGLEALARWMIRFSPVVALQPPDAIFLDLTGCERLFGGIKTIVDRISRALRAMLLTHQIAVAPTSGAAFALAAAGNQDRFLIDDHQLLASLAPLPPWALRIEHDVAAALEHVGIVTIEQLMQIPRSVLPARFGHDLLLRLDQALGCAYESLVPLEHHHPISTSTEFESSIDEIETIWRIFRQLIERVIQDLVRRGGGARQLRAMFKPMYGPAIEKCISLSRPSREAGNLFNLLRCALETIHTDEGFVRFELHVPVFERISDEQSSLVEQEEQDAAEQLEHLIERLSARLGNSAIEKARLVESYIPELAYECVNVATVVIRDGRVSSMDSLPAAPSVRPLHLLKHPVQIGVIVSPSEDCEGAPVSFTHRGAVHRLTVALGPERIAGQWWHGHDKTRDYYDVEDTTGKRFWIFRVGETWKWYLHGEFE
jgi:protein ImuB